MSEVEIAKSLESHYKPEQVFILQQAVELYDFYDRQVRRCDAELEALYGQFGPPQDPGTLPPPKRTKQRRKNQTYFELAPALYRMSGGVDLTQIDGVDELTIQKVLSEIGTDMSQWPTEKHFIGFRWLSLEIGGGQPVHP